MNLIGKEVPKDLPYIEKKRLTQKKKPIKNVFKYNPEKVLKVAKHQTGHEPKKRISKIPPLLPGKRISKNGKIYYEYRRNRSSFEGRKAGINRTI